MFNTILYKHHYYILNSCIGAPLATSHPYFAGSIHHPLLIQSTRYALRFILLIHFKIQSTTRPAFFLLYFKYHK